MTAHAEKIIIDCDIRATKYFCENRLEFQFYVVVRPSGRILA